MNKLPEFPDRADVVELGIIANAVSLYYGVDEKEIFDKSRETKFLKLRQMFFTLSREINLSIYSLRDIGKYCELFLKIKAFNHATVLNAINKANNYLDTDKKYASEYIEIKELVYKLRKEEEYKKEKGFNALKKRVIQSVMHSKDKRELEYVLSKKELKDILEAV